MRLFVLTLALVALLVPAGSQANSFTATTFNSRTGRDLAASAAFEFVDGKLQITLTNTGTTAALSDSDLVSAVFFDIKNDPTLSYTSASLALGSTLVKNDGTSAGTVSSLRSFWDFQYSADGLGATGASYGLGGAGLGIFGGSSWLGKGQPDGGDYLLTTAFFDGGGNLPAKKNPFIKDSIVFLMSVGQEFSVNDIENVRFQWGTSMDDPHSDSVPEPASMLLLGTGLLGAGFVARRRKN